MKMPKVWPMLASALNQQLVGRFNHKVACLEMAYFFGVFDWLEVRFWNWFDLDWPDRFLNFCCEGQQTLRANAINRT